MKKHRIRIKVSNNLFRQTCFFCGRYERSEGIDFCFEENPSVFICSVCKKTPQEWPSLLKEKAEILREQAETAETIAGDEFLLPTVEEWEEAKKARSKLDAEMTEDSEDFENAETDDDYDI